MREITKKKRSRDHGLNITRSITEDRTKEKIRTEQTQSEDSHREKKETK